ncbi:ABC transporter ATP-binding protein [Thermoanaerobacterium sp. DL9XJH110]|uniref:ABC transporter ATP-binding protein n=1 Tax=Thermoanaerobacterium sp. DL9XJH110 TaxID=3386643 RepID=UPI003BB515A4
MGKLLEVNNLEVSFNTYGGQVSAVRGVSFHVNEGECIAIVGESGCGKSVTAKAIMRLIPSPPGYIKGGSIKFNNIDLLAISRKKMQMIRGAEIGMIFQDPMTSLNPTMTIGKQIEENILIHQRISRRKATERTIEILKRVGIPNPEKRINQYPHEFSGGMRQRVMIAMAIVCNPKLLIADEPTTALDVTIQAQILDLMKDLQKSMKTAVIIITHNLGIVANMAKRVMVFYAGKIIESASVEDIFYNPKHPYTWGLLKSVPKLHSQSKERLVSIEGTPPDLFSPPTGCAFAARCEYAMKICAKKYPPMMRVKENHEVTCWLLHERAPKIQRPS